MRPFLPCESFPIFTRSNYSFPRHPDAPLPFAQFHRFLLFYLHRLPFVLSFTFRDFHRFRIPRRLPFARFPLFFCRRGNEASLRDAEESTIYATFMTEHFGLYLIIPKYVLATFCYWRLARDFSVKVSSSFHGVTLRFHRNAVKHRAERVLVFVRVRKICVCVCINKKFRFSLEGSTYTS